MKAASELSSTRSLYSQIHACSNAFSQGWLREGTATLMRSVRDLDDDKSKLFTSTFNLPSIPVKRRSLVPLIDHNFEITRSTVQDISPSGKWTLALKQGGKGDEVPLINLTGKKASHYLDVSDFHGKFVGDSWFGGVSWSQDERFVAYVAFKKENTEKKLDSAKYFEYRGSIPGTNQFEYVDDWGEKYVGLVSLSINVLDTVTGEIITVDGIDDSLWTVGQPVFLPIQNNNPSYRLAYTAWKNGPRKLGMIYCYQRESSIFVTDLTKQLLGTDEKNSEVSADDSVRTAENFKSDTHLLVTPETKLARSARFSPDGSKMVFLGSRKGFASHNGCSELLSVEVADIIRSFKISSEKGSIEKGEKKAIEITTIVSSVGGACTSELSQLENSFPGIYTDQLPRNCFLSNDCVIMSSPWGSVESLIAVHLPTKSIQKIDVPLEGSAPDNANKISSNILDIQRIENADAGMDESRSQLLLTVGTPCSSQVVGVLDVLLRAENNGGKLVISSSLILQPDDYSVAQMPIARKKPTMKKEIAPTLSSEVSMTAETVRSNDDKLYGPNANDLRDRLAVNKDLNSLLSWKTSRYYDQKGIPYESILITPKRTEKGVFGYESMGTDRKCPLIVVPHGGPHSCMTTSYVASYAYLALRLGAAVLHVNYRGSTGFGQDSIDALLGRIGSVDVADMVHCTQDALKLDPSIDPHNVAVVGGSHGGFLAAHLVGQHPEIFKVACMRNPVTDIPGMLSVTDIPDWCYVEALGTEKALKYSRNIKSEEDFNSMPDESDLLKMRECSPIIHVKKVTAPVLMLIGAKDRRVPMSQGVAYYHNLKAKGVPTKLFVFPEDVHAIDRPLSEAEQWIAAAHWLETYQL